MWVGSSCATHSSRQAHAQRRICARQRTDPRMSGRHSFDVLRPLAGCAGLAFNAMRGRTLRLMALVAAVPVAAVMLGTSSVAMPEAPSSWGSHEVPGPDAEDGSGEPARISDRLELDRTGPAGPRFVLDCYPIGRIKPTKPGAIKMPHSTPIRPGPVPMPHVTITCKFEQGQPRSEFLKRLPQRR
jgi:hypothetical protein